MSHTVKGVGLPPRRRSGKMKSVGQGREEASLVHAGGEPSGVPRLSGGAAGQA